MFFTAQSFACGPSGPLQLLQQDGCPGKAVQPQALPHTASGDPQDAVADATRTGMGGAAVLDADAAETTRTGMGEVTGTGETTGTPATIPCTAGAPPPAGLGDDLAGFS